MGETFTVHGVRAPWVRHDLVKASIMDILSPEFFSALMAIVLLDLVLAGDNAIVIGLAARNVPPQMQRRVIFWGTAGAIVIRGLLTLVVVWLLKIPGFLLVGGLALVWIAWNLTRNEGGGEHNIQPATTVRGAIQTIVIADAVMGVDNVLAVGGAAQGSMLLVILGLLISVPIVVWGSTLILKLVDRFPVIVLIGAGVLGWTAARMISSEPLISKYFEHQHFAHLALYGLVVGGVTLPWLWRHAAPRQQASGLLVVLLIVWLGVFDFIEESLGWENEAIDTWQWWHEGLDLLMWVGWVPFALLAYRYLLRVQSAAEVEPPHANKSA